MVADRWRHRQLIAAVLCLATVFFVWGALAERSARHTEQTGAHVEGTTSSTIGEHTGAESPGGTEVPSTIATDAGGDTHVGESSATPTTHVETGGSEGSGAHSDSSSTTIASDLPGAGGSETSPAHTETAAENRKILGVNLESLWVISLGAAVSLALALLVLTRRSCCWLL